MGDIGWMVEVYVTPYEILRLRRAFDVPVSVSNEELAEMVAQFVIDGWMHPSKLSEKDMEQIVDGILHGGEHDQSESGV